MRKIYIQIGYERMISEFFYDTCIIDKLPDHHAEMLFFENIFMPWDFYLKTSSPVMSTTKCCYRLHAVMPVREYPSTYGEFCL